MELLKMICYCFKTMVSCRKSPEYHFNTVLRVNFKTVHCIAHDGWCWGLKRIILKTINFM